MASCENAEILNYGRADAKKIVFTEGIAVYYLRIHHM